MTIEPMYLMADNGRFICVDPTFGDLTIRKDRAGDACRFQAAFDPVDPRVRFYNPATDRGWTIATDPATPHVDHLVMAKKEGWTEFTYQFVDDTRTLMTLQDEGGRYVSRVDIGRPMDYLAAETAEPGASSQFRVIRLEDNA